MPSSTTNPSLNPVLRRAVMESLEEWLKHRKNPADFVLQKYPLLPFDIQQRYLAEVNAKKVAVTQYLTALGEEVFLETMVKVSHAHSSRITNHPNTDSNESLVP